MLEQKIKDTNKENKGELKKTHRRNERTVSSYTLVKKRQKEKEKLLLMGVWVQGGREIWVKNKGRWMGSDE